MAETMSQTFNSLNRNSKKMCKKQKGVNSDILSIYTSQNSASSSTTNSNDWHRLLFAQMKPGVTRKYRTTRKDGNKSDVFSPTSVEDSTVTLQSYSDDSLIIDNREIIITESDVSKQFNSSIENPTRRDNHFVKKSISNRSSSDHMTSLKRRVRKQQMNHVRNQPTVLQETTFQLPSPSNLFLISYPKQAISPRRYRRKKSSSVVSLPPLISTTGMIPNHTHGIKLNLYGY